VDSATTKIVAPKLVLHVVTDADRISTVDRVMDAVLSLITARETAKNVVPKLVPLLVMDAARKPAHPLARARISNPKGT